MLTIFKYPVSRSGTVNIPADAKLLHVAYQFEDLCMWLLVDTEKPPREYAFAVYGTGWGIDAEPLGRLAHLGTVIDAGGFVWHVFGSKELVGK